MFLTQCRTIIPFRNNDMYWACGYILRGVRETTRAMDFLTKEWNCLSLSKQEGDTFDFENQDLKPRCMLVAKFFTKRALSVEVVARTLRPLWKTKQDFHIKDLGNHMILFSFEDDLDVEHVLLGAPWSFDKYLIALCRYESDKSLKVL